MEHGPNIEDQTGIAAVIFAGDNLDLVDRFRTTKLLMMLKKEVCCT